MFPLPFFIAGKHKAERLLSFFRLQPAYTPSDETQRGSGVLSQIHNAELMGVDGGGVTVSASVSVQLSAAVGGILTCLVHNTAEKTLKQGWYKRKKSDKQERE